MYQPTRRAVAGFLAVAAVRPAFAQEGADPLPLIQTIELSGSASLLGDSWRNGVEMALQDINARGGVLGRPLLCLTFDAHAGSGIRSVLPRALEGEPYALLGPVSAAEALASLGATRNARVMQIVGAEAAALTTAGDPEIMRAGIGQSIGLTKLAAWTRDTLRPVRIALICDTSETGRGAHDVLLRELRGQTEIALELAPAPRQTDFAPDIPRLVKSGVDAVFLALGDEEAGHFLLDAKRLGLTASILGTQSLLSPRALKIAGPAANGARAHVGEAADAPAFAAWAARYAALFKVPADSAAIQGHVAVGMVKAATEKLGRADPHALAETLRGQTITVAREPTIIVDSHWDSAGNIDHESAILEVQDKRLVVVRTMPPLS